MTEPAYSRILLKLSGEVLAGPQPYGIDLQTLKGLAQEIKEVSDLGVSIALVLGGGNIFRGLAASASGMDRANADYIGMLATVMNCLAFQDALDREGLVTRVMTALEMREIAEPYVYRRAIRHMEKGRVILLAGGTGNPYFTTDTAAALRALEIHAQAILKGHKGGWGLQRRPGKERLRHLLPHRFVYGCAQRQPQGNGSDGHLHVHGRPASDPRLQYPEERQHSTGPRGRIRRVRGKRLGGV